MFGVVTSGDVRKRKRLRTHTSCCYFLPVWPSALRRANWDQQRTLSGLKEVRSCSCRAPPVCTSSVAAVFRLCTCRVPAVFRLCTYRVPAGFRLLLCDFPPSFARWQSQGANAAWGNREHDLSGTVTSRTSRDVPRHYLEPVHLGDGSAQSGSLSRQHARHLPLPPWRFAMEWRPPLPPAKHPACPSQTPHLPHRTSKQTSLTWGQCARQILAWTAALRDRTSCNCRARQSRSEHDAGLRSDLSPDEVALVDRRVNGH